MEGKKDDIMAMTDAEFDILDEVYFVTGYQTVREQLELSEADFSEGLRGLLQKGFVQQLYFDPDQGDYLKRDTPDLQQLSHYHYLATKEGLLAHNL